MTKMRHNRIKVKIYDTKIKENSMNNYFDDSGLIMFQCDVCGRRLNGINYYNGMSFCAKCYQETFCNKNMNDNLNNMYEAYLKLLNEKDQRIAELEEQLKNAIVPKFKIGQEVWFIYDENDDCNYIILNKKVMAYNYFSYEGGYFEYAMSDDGTRDTIWYGYVDARYVFATKEEALAKLQELGENK